MKSQKNQAGGAAGVLPAPPVFTVLVGTAGFEPATPASRTLCSTRLSHVPTFGVICIGLLLDCQPKIDEFLKRHGRMIIRPYKDPHELGDPLYGRMIIRPYKDPHELGDPLHGRMIIRPYCVKGVFTTMVSFLPGPTDTRSIGVSVNSSIRLR